MFPLMICMANIYVQERQVFLYWCETDIDGELANSSSCVGWNVRADLSNFE
jgi:hypothetical protein